MLKILTYILTSVMRYLANVHQERKSTHEGIINLSWVRPLSKAIMQRTRLRNKFLKNPTNQNRLTYTKQRNFCLLLLRKEKKEYFPNVNEKDITDNRKFWYTAKSFLSDKIKSRENIILVNNEKIISDGVEVANTPNIFLSNIIKNLKLPLNIMLRINFHKAYQGT